MLQGTVVKRELLPFELDACSRAAHEVNRAFCISHGDNTHEPYDTAPEWQKESSRLGVLHIARHDTTPEQSHENWLAHKQATGWKYGPVKDVEKKEHPCMVPYNELPRFQQVKDELYTTVVKAMLHAIWTHEQQ